MKLLSELFRVSGLSLTRQPWPGTGVIRGCGLFMAAALLSGSVFAGEPEPPGLANVAVDFQGPGAYIETGLSASALGLAGDAARTIEVWVFTRSFVDTGGAFSLGRRGASGEDFSLRALGTDDLWRLQQWGGDAIDLDFSYPSKDRWVHFAMVYTGSESIVYANGSEIDRQRVALETSDDRPFRIGSLDWGRYRPEDFSLDGKVREVRIWNRALAGDEIKEQMLVSLTGREDGLVAYWPLNDSTGTTARDLVAGNDGTLRGNARWVPASTFDANLSLQGGEVNPGDTVTLGPIGLYYPEGEVTYQWYHNGRPLTGATANTLVIDSFTADDLGSYYLVADDDRPVTPVETPPAIFPEWPLWRHDLEPAIAAVPGDTVTLGPAELYDPHGEVTYQWYHNGRPLAGATGDTLTLSGISDNDFGAYHVVVDDDLDLTPVESSRVVIARPDWPMWGYDAARSFASPNPLAEELHLQWVRQLPAPERAWPFQWDDRGKLDFDVSYSPVVMGERIFVPSNVNDSLSAYSIEDGRELWRFHADGPVRLAPAAWRDRVYFVSDDGYLYCLSAESGELLWRFRGGPSDHRLLGNERVVNFWAARGGPVVYDGTVYFAAGVWPLHGVFIHALDARTGEVVWVNDILSSEYVELPHGGADGYGGLSPQGYLAANEEQLVIAAGRGQSPVFLDRASGGLIHQSFRGRKGGGGYAVHAVDGGGLGRRGNEKLKNRVRALSEQIEGRVFCLLAANERLFVTTECGRLYCFGSAAGESLVHDHEPSALASGGDWAAVAGDLLEELGEREGYALLLGAGSGNLMRELLRQSDLHVVVVEKDPALAGALRAELSAAGRYGRQGAAVIVADPAGFRVQPYLFSLVASEDAAAAGLAVASPADSFWGRLFARSEVEVEQDVMAGLLNLLRPYGGVAWLGAGGSVLPSLARVASASGVNQVAVERRRGHLFARRGGPLSGAGQWTHQHHDPANTLSSKDQLARLPLGVLWYGGPNNHNILPRHSGGPRPQISGGRQVFLGVDSIAARCVYTGRPLWQRDLPGIGHPFTNLDLEKRWRAGDGVYMTNIPGATYIGSPLVSLPEAIYLRYQGKILQLDPATGNAVSLFSLPGRPVGELYGEDAPDWGHVSVQGDYLVTTSEPHIFEDQVLGWDGSYSGTSSRMVAVYNRHSGRLLWQREAETGFRHNAIISCRDTLFLVDGLSENAVKRLARRGQEAEAPSRIMALDLSSGEEKWISDSEVFGTFLLYSREHDILVEGGSQDLRRRLSDEPRNVTARRGATGEILWRGGQFLLPAALRGEKLIPGRPGEAISLLTGEKWMRRQPETGTESNWQYSRRYGCNTLNASEHLLLYRTGYAGFYDLEHDSGTGNLSGFRSGCTPSMIAADGVVNALDYTRTCTCSYALQTSLAMVHMPGDPNIELWTRYDAAMPDPLGHGLNFGAPGRRVDVAGSGMVWHDRPGNHRRHASAIVEANGAPPWVLASCREFNREDEAIIRIDDLAGGSYLLRLHFAELDPSVSAGERVFDLLVDGEPVLRDFDIVANAGAPLRGVSRELAIEAGSRVVVQLVQSGDSRRGPAINGLELVRRPGG